MGREIGDISLFIDNEWVRDTDRRLEVINPADQQRIGTVAVAQSRHLEAALASAQQGFEVWRRTDAVSRGAILMRAASLVRERAPQTARLLTLEQGKPFRHALTEVLDAAEIMEWYASEAGRITGTLLPPRKSGARQSVFAEPIGPVAAFTPWNFPVLLTSRKISAALAAGCSCILKPSEETPAAVATLADALRDAGLPPGVLNVVYGDPSSIAAHLIPSPTIRKVSLTGSIAAGRAVAALAAQGPKPCTMELGGHAPVFVLPDADIDFSAKLAAVSKTYNAGQVCTSPTRFFVHSSVFESFAKSLAGNLERTRIGDGMDADSRMGPLANQRRLDAMDELTRDALDKGADLLTGGKRIGNSGYFWQPTLLANVTADMAVTATEPFGPIATLERYDELDEAVAISNRSTVGLAAYVFSRSGDIAARIADGLDVGVVGINSFELANPEAPFSGVKSSGYGYEGGSWGLEGYLHYKYVNQLNRNG
ncbi:MAG: NAD-dependent succinate-semialdehyde dehydrogenase [Flavobacteriaceae bacterium]